MWNISFLHGVKALLPIEMQYISFKMYFDDDMQETCHSYIAMTIDLLKKLSLLFDFCAPKCLDIHVVR